MRKRTWIAVLESISLFLSCMLQSGLSQVSLAKGKENMSESVLTQQSDLFGEKTVYGYIPVHKRILNKKDLGSDRMKMSNDRLEKLPASYDAREEGLLTEIKDQGVLELCWVFASIGAMEANILKKELEPDPDLSEYHLAYSSYNKVLDPLGLTEEDVLYPTKMNNDLYMWGGNAYMVTSALARWQGIAPEKVAPMTTLQQMTDAGEVAKLSNDIMYGEDQYHLQNVEFIYLTEKNRDLIKRKLMEFGSAGAGMYAPTTEEDEKLFCNTQTGDFTAYYCDDPSKESNHEVMIVGWDDNYKVENFNSSCQPSNPGAWLIRNSWGDYNELGGYFWMSYEDVNLQATEDDAQEAVFYDVELANNYEWNYQYDGGVPTRYIIGCDAIANVYTSQQNEKIQAVSFYTQERNVEYTIKIYRLSDAANPTSGSQLGDIITGTVSERGYHTIDFSDVGKSDIPVMKGTQFSVVLSLTNSDGDGSYYTMENYLGFPQTEERVDLGEGESFVQSDKEWEDFKSPSSGVKDSTNFCLKAFTSSVQLEEIQQPAFPSTQQPDNSSHTGGEVNPTVASDSSDVKNPTIPIVGQTKPIVKKLIFKPKVKTVKRGKKIKLSKYLKITKQQSGTLKIIYEFTKKKYKKYASLSKKGVFKAKKAGKKKVLYVKARAMDGSGKSAKIKIKIK